MPDQTTHHEATLTHYDAAPGTDDRSDMYVLDVLGVTLLVRKRDNGDGGAETYVHVETTEGCALEVNNGGVQDIGDV